MQEQIDGIENAAVGGKSGFGWFDKLQKAKSKKQKANGQLARGPLDAELKSLLIKTTHGGNASQSSLTGIFLYTKYLEGCELTTFR